MARINSTFKDRRIRAENVTVGDTIRWTEKNGDIQVSRVGIVARIESIENIRYLFTPERRILGTYTIAAPSKSVVTLLKPAPENEAQPLESFQKLLDRAARVVVE